MYEGTTTLYRTECCENSIKERKNIEVAEIIVYGIFKVDIDTIGSIKWKMNTNIKKIVWEL